MEFYMKLPCNKKEFALFMAVISLISVNIIAPLITCFELGLELGTSAWSRFASSFSSGLVMPPFHFSLKHASRSPSRASL